MKVHKIYLLPAGLLTLTLVAGSVLVNHKVEAESANASVVVPAACSFEATIDSPHTAEITALQYKTDIGATTFKTICNDNEGFSIYAIGYSGEEYGNNKLLATIGGSLAPSYDIVTGTATSGNTSNWAMKLSAISGTYSPSILSDSNGTYTQYHEIPSIYTKVATFTSNTDAVVGSSIKSTYAAYITGIQPAGTYTGKVKYTMVHPASEVPKDDPRFMTTLDTGRTVNQKLKRLAGNSSATYNTTDNNITALVRSDTLPNNFTPTTENTISATSSAKPIYAWYDPTNTTIYYYSEAITIKMNQDSSYFFCNMHALSNLSTISSWNTSNVTNMYQMFFDAGYDATTFTLDLSSWNTSNVTDTSNMFSSAGYNATTFTLDLSSWNTASVTFIPDMFFDAGYRATAWSVTIPRTNNGTATGAITNTTTRLYGSFNLVYAEPPSGKSFTIAN